MRLLHPRTTALAAACGLLLAGPTFAEDTLFDGPYLGVQAGHGSLRSHLSGPRGPGSNEADMGAGGGTIGAFAGYGFTFDGVYLGAELEGDLANLGWDHSRPDSRTFSIDQPHSYGISIRAGGLIGESVLLYGRAGLTRTRLENDYSVRSGRSFDEDETAHGVRIGGGAEMAASSSLFVRLDYTMTGFGENDVQSSGRGNQDTFDSEESLFRVGIGYRLPIAGGGSGPDLPAADPTRFDGFYAGAAISHDVVHSEQFGPRNVLPDTLTVDRADDGIGGALFGGWGTTFGQAYVGAEIEASLSGAQWEHDRSNPNSDAGRQVSVRVAETYGAALRAGWVVNDRALLYGRGGLVRTRFETDYAVPRTGVYDDDRMETGLRFGGGAEILVAENVSLRLDYSWTDFDSYAIDYVAPDGSPATDTFDNDVTSFRLGVAYHF